MGQLLRVDLTSGSIRTEPLPDETVLRKLWGGQALASYFLLRELPLDAKPLGPESVISMMTGPISGTGLVPGATKIASPATCTSMTARSSCATPPRCGAKARVRRRIGCGR